MTAASPRTWRPDGAATPTTTAFGVFLIPTLAEIRAARTAA
jgi:hypothetical protein